MYPEPLPKLEIQIWITVETEDDDPRGQAIQILEDMHVPGLVKAQTINGISYEWDWSIK